MKNCSDDIVFRNGKVAVTDTEANYRILYMSKGGQGFGAIVLSSPHPQEEEVVLGSK